MFRQFTENFVMENANVTVPVVLFRVYWLCVHQHAVFVSEAVFTGNEGRNCDADKHTRRASQTSSGC